jgi:hypothetical protein
MRHRFHDSHLGEGIVDRSGLARTITLTKRAPAIQSHHWIASIDAADQR